MDPKEQELVKRVRENYDLEASLVLADWYDERDSTIGALIRVTHAIGVENRKGLWGRKSALEEEVREDFREAFPDYEIGTFSCGLPYCIKPVPNSRLEQLGELLQSDYMVMVTYLDFSTQASVMYLHLVTLFNCKVFH